MHRLTEYRCDPELTDVLIGDSYAAALWLKKQGIRFQPALGRQAFKVGGKFKFWGGLACHLLGGGAQLVKTLHETVERAGIEVLYDTTAVALLHGAAACRACACAGTARRYELRAKAVVLACGGFESNPEMRARYLGPELGPREGARHPLQQRPGPPDGDRVGAATHGHWSGAHAVQLGRECAAVRRSRRSATASRSTTIPSASSSTRAGSASSTRAPTSTATPTPSTGTRCSSSPGLFAWQVFDQKIVGLLREEYRIPRITKETADTFEELAPKLTGVDAKGFLRDRARVQRGAAPRRAFNPNIHDGLRTSGLAIDKTNWANKLDAPPYHAYGVTTGITFTFGGLRVSTSAEVQDTTGAAIRGLYAAGEIVGGLYYHNYGSGTGLVAGVVFGRIAGREAAKLAAGSA